MEKSDDFSCYVTGASQEYIQPYSFGDSIILPLTQEAFAHFVIRAKKCPIHETIMQKLKKNYDDGQVIVAKYKPKKGSFSVLDTKPTLNDDSFIDTQLAATKVDAEHIALLSEKAHSGIRILRAMRDQYRRDKSFDI